VSVVRAEPLFWFLLFCALASAGFFLGAMRDRDSPLAWAAAVAFALICLAAASELLLWRSP
jgi:hypothetical protein